MTVGARALCYSGGGFPRPRGSCPAQHPAAASCLLADLPSGLPCAQLGTARRLGSIVEDTSSIQALASDPVEQKSVAVAESPAPVPQSKVIVNPLDPVDLSTWCLESSGLLKVRPPLPAAASGSDVTYIIPFQVCHVS